MRVIDMYETSKITVCKLYDGTLKYKATSHKTIMVTGAYMLLWASITESIGYKANHGLFR